MKQAIQSAPELSQAQRQVAISDLSNLTAELKKPINEQDVDTKKLFWERLTEVMKFSSSLMALSATVAKLIGII